MSGDIGVWMVSEQKLYRVSDERGIGFFARVSGAPADRNLIDLYADTGVEFIGLSDARQDDKFGIAAGYAHVSKRAQALDADCCALINPNWPMRSFEGLLTAVYQYQIKRLDTTAQFPIHHPSGWRCDKSFRSAGGKSPQERNSVRAANDPEILRECREQTASTCRRHRPGLFNPTQSRKQRTFVARQPAEEVHVVRGERWREPGFDRSRALSQLGLLQQPFCAPRLQGILPPAVLPAWPSPKDVLAANPEADSGCGRLSCQISSAQPLNALGTHGSKCVCCSVSDRMLASLPGNIHEAA